MFHISAERSDVRKPDRGEVEPHGMCVCPDAQHDNWECPTCHRPSFSAERIAALRA